MKELVVLPRAGGSKGGVSAVKGKPAGWSERGFEVSYQVRCSGILPMPSAAGKEGLGAESNSTTFIWPRDAAILRAVLPSEVSYVGVNIVSF